MILLQGVEILMVTGTVQESIGQIAIERTIIAERAELRNAIFERVHFSNSPLYGSPVERRIRIGELDKRIGQCRSRIRRECLRLRDLKRVYNFQCEK